MLTPIRHHRTITVVALIATGIFAATPATSLAQEIEEIVVTAQKREQSLQDVSMSLSAFTGLALEERAIEDLSDLQYSVPNLLADSARVTIRGVGQNAISSTAEQGLGYHLNGVYVNRALARNSEYFDVERIEVLRGPQGTLYGRNTTAGVINIISKKPTDEFGGYMTLGVGDYESYRAKGAINLPLGDGIAQRFAGSYLSRDGYDTNLYTGNSIDGRDQYELRSTTSIDFSDATSADLVFYYFKEDSNRSSETKGTCTKDPTYGCSPLSAGFETPDVSGSLWQSLNAAVGGALYPAGDYFADAINPADYRTSNVDQEPTYEAEQKSISLEINHTFGDYTFTSLTGYIETTTDVFQDFDRFVPSVGLNFPVTYRANARDIITTDVIQSGRRDTGDAQQFTQEFRVASNRDSQFNFLLGAFIYSEESENHAIFTHPSMAFIQQVTGRPYELEMYDIASNPVKTDSFAVFGEGYFDLTDMTRLTVGIRYTEDKKSIRTRGQLLALVPWTSAEADWDEFTGKVTLEHFLSDDSLVFATVARGYKAGGLNPSQGTVFDPELVNQFEVGTKNTFVDGRLRANFGLFMYDYEDLQIGQVDQTSAVTVNGSADVFGAEAEFNWLATDALEFDLNFSWLDLSLNDFQSADEGDPDGIAPGTIQAVDDMGNPIFTPAGLVVKNLDGNALRNAPEFSLKFGAQYTMMIADGYELTGRVDYFWQDEYFANEFNKPSDEIGSWSQTDMNFSLTPESEKWSLRLYAKNLMDNDDVMRRGQDGELVGRFRSVTVLEPRTVGVELNLPFE